ncbi:RNA polymerase subunit sigma-70 [Ahniella affigens]|uniref:RNA polymerase subunit sigma-70 n=2 Tax=Ahniella affigens TaxID=2021234 RepID=A0A2P1PQ53_9GAMM|nr:RNA polymerase subunit sigma-70 [Ahniella affigens]
MGRTRWSQAPMDESDITARLNDRDGDLAPEVYARLRALAQRQIAGHRASATLNATALVNEAWLKLSEYPQEWQSRSHFLAAMARVMRHVLIDRARELLAERRGGDQQRISFEHAEREPSSELDLADLLALDEALSTLRDMDPRLERVLELRLFGGLSTEETAAHLGVSEPTVKRDLRAARAFLGTRLKFE